MGKQISRKNPAGQHSLGDNPWVKLPSRPPFFFLRDFDNLRVLPVPYLGVPPKAHVFVLQMNPGLAPSELDLMRNSDYVDQNRKSLTFESRVPFWILDEQFSETPGCKYWKAKFKWLAKELGDAFVREHIVCVEFFPYHSKEFSGPREPVPSQAFAFSLVRQAMRRRLPIVVMRGGKTWSAALPELASYPYRFSLLGRGRNVAISPGNMQAGKFDELIASLRSKPRRATARRGA